MPTIPQMAGFITYFMTVSLDMLLYHTRVKKTTTLFLFINSLNLYFIYNSKFFSMRLSISTR
jgi:hypothetical protein